MVARFLRIHIIWHLVEFKGGLDRCGKNCYHWTSAILFLSGVFISNTAAFAHHGGVSSAFGPGAPIETASPLALGKGRYLIY